MNQLIQNCQYKGHEGNKVKYICLDAKCELKRQYCFQCLTDNNHKHGQEHKIFNHEKFGAYIQRLLELLKNEDSQKENDSFAQQCMKIISVLQLQMDNISNILHELSTRSYLQKYIQSLEKKLETVSTTKLSKVDDQFISELVNMDLNQKRLLMKQQINKQTDLLLKNALLLQEISAKEIQTHKLGDSQYEGTQIDQQACSKILINQKDQALNDDKGLKISMCSYLGHEKNKVKFICLDDNCQQNKLICQQCINDNLHKHQIFDHNGLKTLIEFKIDQLQKQVQQVDCQFVQRCIALIRIIQQQMNKILENLGSLVSKSYIQTKIISLQNLLQIIIKSKLQQVDDKFISQFTSTSVDFVENQQHIFQEISKSSDILQRNSIIIEQLSTKEELIIKIKNNYFEIAQIGQLNDQVAESVIISNDLKYIVSCHQDKFARVWNYQNYSFIQKFDLSYQVFISKFTDDSTLLYIGSKQGLLYCYDVKNNFKQTYINKIHTNSILNLYCLTNNLVLTSSFDQRIIKTNTQTNQKSLAILVIKAHDDRIDGLDYNKSKDVIVSCSKDNFIKLWNNQTGSLLIKHQNTYQSIINQVLFVNSDQLISLDTKPSINIWQINYQSEKLLLRNTINDQNIIFNMSLVLNQSLILFICNEYMKFYTIQGEYVHLVKHDVKEFCMMRQVQLNQQLSKEKNSFRYLE